MAGNSDNIIIGAADISINGEDVGFTKGGVVVKYAPEFLDVVADQAVGVVRKARTNERVYITTTLLEITLERIRQAFMQPSSHLAGSTLTLGYNNVCWVEELAIVITGVSPGCGTRTFTFGRCITMGEREYAMKRDEEAAFEVEFEVLKDAQGTFGTIVDS